MKPPVIKVILRNYAEPMEITSIDYINKTFTWDYLDRKITDSFECVDSWEVTQ